MKYSGSISDRIKALRAEMRREKIDLYIIPSSIHECIVLPDDCSIHDVKEMLGAANDIIVSDCGVYRGESGALDRRALFYTGRTRTAGQ